MCLKTMCRKGGRAARGQVFTYVLPRACMQAVCSAPSGLASWGKGARPPANMHEPLVSRNAPDGCGHNARADSAAMALNPQHTN